MPPNLSGRVTVGDETLEPVLNVEVQYRKINQQICRGDVPALPWVLGGDQRPAQRWRILSDPYHESLVTSWH